MILSIGTSRRRWMRPKNEGKIIPLSRAIAYNSRDADVIQPIVPLKKHIASITDKITVPARLFVTRYMSSVMGWPVSEEKIEVGSTRQNNITRMNPVPLLKVSYMSTKCCICLRDASDDHRHDHCQRSIPLRCVSAFQRRTVLVGVLHTLGVGISSVMCSTTS